MYRHLIVFQRFVPRGTTMGQNMFSVSCISRQYSTGSTTNGRTDLDSSITTDATTIATSTSDQPYIDALDKLFSFKPFEGFRMPEFLSNFSSHGAEVLSQFQVFTGIDSFVILFLFGFGVRLLTLLFSLYGERATARMLVALPEIQAAQMRYTEVKESPSSSALKIHEAAVAFKNERQGILKAHQTSNIGCFASLASGPFFMSGLLVSTAFSASKEASSFLWCPSLAGPDPLYVFPSLCCAVTLLNFEWLLAPALRGEPVRRKQLFWVARLAAVVMVPVIGAFHSGVCLFFLGMNMAGLLQPLVLRSTGFRQLLRFPSVGNHSVSASTSSKPPKVVPVKNVDHVK